MPRPINEIVHELTHDRQPGADGCSNVDRIAFISAVTGMDSICVSEDYDFSQVIRCEDWDLVSSAKHIAMLQLDYLRRTYENYHISYDEYQASSGSLILEIQRINWHLKHLEEGKRTPPFSFIH